MLSKCAFASYRGLEKPTNFYLGHTP